MRRATKHRQWGRWKKLDRIAKGGQGIVYKAIRLGEEGGEVCALKEVPFKNQTQRERFKREIMGQLSLLPHRNIMPILDHNLDEVVEAKSKWGYYVMPLAKQGSLFDHRALYRGQLELTLKSFRQICDGIRHAHEHGIIHRDLKPRNIMFLDDVAIPLITDFGICFLLDFSDQERLTQMYESVGPRHFIAPEQERGFNEDVDERVDIYSLGKLLHFMSIGGDPYIYREEYMGDNDLVKLLNDTRFDIINKRLLSKMIVKDKTQRFNSMDELLAEVDTIIQMLTGGPSSSAVLPSSGSPPDIQTPMSPKQSFQTSESIIDETTQMFRMADEIGVKEKIKILMKQLKNEWNLIYKDVQSDPNRHMEALKRLEEISDCIIAVGFPAIEYDKLNVLKEDLLSRFELIMNLPKSLSGYVTLLSIPLFLVHNMYYCWGALAIYEHKIEALKLLLNHQVPLLRMGRIDYEYIFDNSEIFHPELFKGSASKAFDYLVENYKSKPFIKDAFFGEEDSFLNAHCQFNFLICLKIVREMEINEITYSFWANFGRFYEHRLDTLISKLKRDQEFTEHFAKVLFDESGNTFMSALSQRLKVIIKECWGDGSGFIWNSIEPDAIKNWN